MMYFQWSRLHLLIKSYTNGIAVSLKNQPARVLIGDTASHRKFDMAMFAWVAAPESVPRAELSSNNALAPA